MNEKWFAMSLEDIEKKLKTNAALGLSAKAAESRRRDKEAPFFSVKKKRWDRILLELFSDIFLVVLTFVSVFSLFFQGDYVIGSAMILLVLVNIGISFVLHYRESRVVTSISRLFTPNARVIRGGKLYIEDYRNVVLGDVILIERGDILGCDVRLVHSDGLCVNMMLDKKNKKLLKKYAGALVDEKELYAENMTNMIHAGSTVKEGSGRAIVVATGEYTYLGAITGGITEIPNEELPRGLVGLNRYFSRLGMILLILMLPFCIFSLIFGHFTGGTTVLSEAVAVALSIGATAMLSRVSTLSLAFFSRYIRKAALADNPCMMRSPKTFDDISAVDVLFMMDGSVTTDGILHYDGFSTADGTMDKYGRIGESATVLSETIAIYSMARKNSVATVGGGAGGPIDIGIDEFFLRSKVDMAAFKIRCTIHSFVANADKELGDIVSYTDGVNKKELYVCGTPDIIARCGYAVFAGAKKEMTSVGADSLRSSFDSLTLAGKRPVIFVIKENDEYCFVGMLVLKEGIDPSASRALSALRRNGVTVISFSNCQGRKYAPEVPEILRRGGVADALDFAKKGLPITYNFGSYDEYCRFDSKSIAELARHVKAQNKVLAVMGFSDYAPEAIECADVFMTCAPVSVSSGGYLDEEIMSMDIPGEMSSASCTQEVKMEADVLLMRPDGSRGGLEPLSRIIEYGKAAYRNLNSFLVYLAAVNFMRIFTVAFPMLWGNTVADARHLLFFGFVFDLLAMFIFAADTRRVTENRSTLRKRLDGMSIEFAVKSNARLSICVVLGSVLTLLLPEIFGILGYFGGYVHKAEFAFVSLMLMHIAVFWLVYKRDGNDKTTAARLFRNIFTKICLAVCAMFLLVCFLTPVGKLFGVVRLPLFYLMLAIVPALAFVICYTVMGNKAKNKK